MTVCYRRVKKPAFDRWLEWWCSKSDAKSNVNECWSRWHL